MSDDDYFVNNIILVISILVLLHIGRKISELCFFLFFF